MSSLWRGGKNIPTNICISEIIWSFPNVKALGCPFPFRAGEGKGRGAGLSCCPPGHCFQPSALILKQRSDMYGWNDDLVCGLCGLTSGSCRLLLTKWRTQAGGSVTFFLIPSPILLQNVRVLAQFGILNLWGGLRTEGSRIWRLNF